jgi:hypothetical protein
MDEKTLAGHQTGIQLFDSERIRLPGPQNVDEEKCNAAIEARCVDDVALVDLDQPAVITDDFVEYIQEVLS